MGYANNTYRKVQYPDGDYDYRPGPRELVDGWPVRNSRPVKQQKKRRGRSLCGKTRYADEYTASKKLKKAQAWAARNGRRMPVRYYYHRKCQGYHLTSEEKEEAA